MYEEKTKVCPNCRRDIDYYETTCSYCQQKQEVNFEDDRIPYIRSTVGTYLRKFEKLDKYGTKIDWNWCGFLFGANWMIYRKLYLQFAIYFFTPLLLQLMAYLLASGHSAVGVALYLLSALVSFVMWIVGGLFSDYWYKIKIEKLVEEGASLDQDEREAFAKKKGGTSFGLLVLVLILNMIINIASTALLGGLGM